MTVNRISRKRKIFLGVIAAGAAASAAAATVPAFADEEDTSTPVTPTGPTFSASLVPGTTADFAINANRFTTITARCDTSNTAGQASDALDNLDSASGVSAVLSPLVFTNTGGEGCPVTAPILGTIMSVALASTDANGDWVISLQRDANGSTGTLTIPRAGVVVTREQDDCTITVAPDNAATVTGSFVPAANGGAPQLVFSDVPVPITATGTGCPGSATEATFTATYAIANTTDPNQPSAVNPNQPSEADPDQPTTTDPDQPISVER